MSLSRFAGGTARAVPPLGSCKAERAKRVVRAIGRHWIWKSAVAGLCGSIAHSLLMYFKFRSGLLPTFQPYDNLQAALSE